MFLVFQFSWYLFTVFPKCSQNFPKKIHYGCIFQDILNIPLWNISVTSFLHILNFTSSVNCSYFTGDITKNTLNNPPRNTVGTFFGNILKFPTHFLIRKSPGNTVNDLNTSQAGDISVKLAENSECPWNILGGYWLSPLSISLQCICDVLGRDTTPCPQCYIVPFDPLGNPLGTILTAAQRYNWCFKHIKRGSLTTPYPDPATIYHHSAISDPEDNMFEDIYLGDMWVSCLLYFCVWLTGFS
jgi:hypothetical protein